MDVNVVLCVHIVANDERRQAALIVVQDFQQVLVLKDLSLILDCVYQYDIFGVVSVNITYPRRIDHCLSSLALE